MFYEYNGAKLFYKSEGEGAPVVLLHGWGGRADSFLPLIRDLSATRRVLAVDFPGHGESPEPPEAWSVSEYADLIWHWLKDLDLENVDLAAHSFGGRVALLLSSEHPEMVSRMVLTGCAGIPPRKTGKKTMKSRVYKILRKLADNGFTRGVFKNAVPKWREKLVQKFGSPDYRALTPSMRGTFNRVIGQDLTPVLEKIQAPTLLVWGTQDTETPLWMGQLMEEKIADAALVPLEGGTHFAYLEQYAKFLSIVKVFFNIQ